jgi:hypothetical protein
MEELLKRMKALTDNLRRDTLALEQEVNRITNAAERRARTRSGSDHRETEQRLAARRLGLTS